MKKKDLTYLILILKILKNKYYMIKKKSLELSDKGLQKVEIIFIKKKKAKQKKNLVMWKKLNLSISI